MARERYLLGVSEEELRPDPKPEGPKTPKAKWDNYWYHYKWHTIGGLFIVIVATVLIVQMATKNNPDYTIVLATDTYTSDEACQRLQTELETYGRDIDGDGKVEVEIENLYLGSSDSQYSYTYKTKLIAHLSSADMMFYIFDKASYDDNIANQETDGYQFFTPIGVSVNGLEGDGRYWNWKSDALRTDPALSSMPENLYFGVRDVSGTASKQTALHDQCLELLQAFLTKTPLQTENAG